eukprot:2268827-Prymnesium_polylepis.1
MGVCAAASSASSSSASASAATEATVTAAAVAPGSSGSSSWKPMYTSLRAASTAVRTLASISARAASTRAG